MIKKIEPYRILFPIGTLYAFTGVLLWLIFAWIPATPYPGASHTKTMIGGFLIAYVMGFLMTAIPKMTASFPAALWEIVLAAVIVIMSGLLALGNFESTFFASVFVAFVFLAIFGLRRFSARAKAVPDFFVFVGSGLLSGVVGSLILSISPGNAFGRLILFQGMLLSLVLGIGCRLIPLICGLTPVERASRLRFIVVASLLWVSFALEALAFTIPGLVLRAVCVTWVGIFYWQLLSPPKSPSRLAFLIKASAVMVLAGPWMAITQPALALHWMHLTYVGGFGLMTFTVASRVTLAHGSFDLGFESRSKSLYWVGGFLFAAAVTRAIAPLIDGYYFSHLQYAAILWLVGVCLWAWVFVQKMIKLGTMDKPAC